MPPPTLCSTSGRCWHLAMAIFPNMALEIGLIQDPGEGAEKGRRPLGIFQNILSSSFSRLRASSLFKILGDPPASLLNTFHARRILGWGNPPPPRLRGTSRRQGAGPEGQGGVWRGRLCPPTQGSFKAPSHKLRSVGVGGAADCQVEGGRAHRVPIGGQGTPSAVGQ